MPLKTFWYVFVFAFFPKGIAFLDGLSSLWRHRGFSVEDFKTECIIWLELLLGLVDITGDHYHAHLKKFLGHTGVVEEYHDAIVDLVSGIHVRVLYSLHKIIKFCIPYNITLE